MAASAAAKSKKFQVDLHVDLPVGTVKEMPSWWLLLNSYVDFYV